MTLDEWLEIGFNNKFIDQFCYTHDLAPMTNEEVDNYYTDADMCIPMFRVWIKD